MITVNEFPLGSNIIYDIRSDDRNELDDYIDNIERLYPSWGYGTMIEWDEHHGDGVYYVRIKRSQSCD